MADRVKQVAAEESKRVKEMATDAVKSRTYLYPLKVNDVPQSATQITLANRCRASTTLSLTKIFGNH